MHVLLVGSAKLPQGVSDFLTDDRWTVEQVPDGRSAVQKAKHSRYDAVIVGEPSAANGEYGSLLRFVDAQRLAAVVVGAGADDRGGVSDGSLIDWASPSISKDELAWRLLTLTRFQSHVRRVEDELEHVQRLGRRLNQHFRELDDEMRLASKLQRDFLPRSMDQIGPLRFASLFRPASWVSGDIFDIQRLDERYVGFYIADAVGHGLAAGLLTMYLKRTLVTKRIVGSSYEIVPPDEALKAMNDALTEQALPNCQFVTALYCVVDTESLVMRFARGGHPHPVVLSAEGHATEVKSPGGLLGLFPGTDFPAGECQLHPGDKVLLYTDGLESACEHLATNPGGVSDGHLRLFEKLHQGAAAETVAGIEKDLDERPGSLIPADDITVLAVEVLGA